MKRDGKWLRSERTSRGWSTITTADRARAVAQRQGSSLKLTQQSVSGYETRTPKREPEWLRYVVEAFAEHDEGAEAGHDNTRPEQPVVRSADAGETAPITRLDLSYAMGPGTNLDDAHIEGESVELDIAFLRRLTPSPPEALRIVSGVGDSMHPTIHDREELIIDTAQTRLNMQDRIWAIALFEAGALKRLRTISRDRVLVISDNPDVPDQEVGVGDVHIVGRLVGSIRRH